MLKQFFKFFNPPCFLRCVAENKRGSVFRRSPRILRVNAPTILQTNLLTGSLSLSTEQHNDLLQQLMTDTPMDSVEAWTFLPSPTSSEVADVNYVEKRESLTLRCNVDGKPGPKLIWLFYPMAKSSEMQPVSSEIRTTSTVQLVSTQAGKNDPVSYHIDHHNQTLTITVLRANNQLLEAHSGRHFCLAVNPGGVAVAWQVCKVAKFRETLKFSEPIIRPTLIQ